LHDGIALVSLVTIGNEVIGLLPIAAINLLLVTKRTMSMVCLASSLRSSISFGSIRT
jgi:hypothetical protein